MAEALHMLIVDDQRHARQSRRALLATRFPLIRTLEAENGIEALKRVKDWLPAIVLMDARMPDLDGIELNHAMKRQWTHVKVIVLSMFAEYHAATLEADADVFMSKCESPGSEVGAEGIPCRRSPPA